MKKFSAVKFYNNQWAVVPTTWIMPDGAHCYYPSKDIHKLAKACASPEMTWSLWNVREVLATSGKTFNSFF